MIGQSSLTAVYTRLPVFLQDYNLGLSPLPAFFEQANQCAKHSHRILLSDLRVYGSMGPNARLTYLELTIFTASSPFLRLWGE